MKKIYAFLAAALMSVSVFAAKDVVPSDQVIKDACSAETGQVVVAIFVPADMACFDVVFVGTYNKDSLGNWITDLATLKKFEAIEGYDGWYAVAVNDETDSPEGKPVMLDVDGNFNWDYQVGSATVLRGSVTIEAGLPGEINMKNYSKDAPNVFTVDSWKNNPCTAVYHNYNVQVISDGCGGLAVPFIIGGMNNWGTPQEMQIDEAKTMELQVPVYYLNFKAAEGTEYQLLSGLRDPQTGKIDSTAQPGWNDASYLNVYVDGIWQRYNPNNSKLDTAVSVVYDLRVDTLRWNRCAPAETAEQVEMNVKLPALNCPQSVEVIGTFDGWQGTVMAFENTGYFYAFFEAKPSQFFKFRSAGAWDQEIELLDPQDDTWRTIQDNEYVFGKLWQEGSCYGDPCKTITLDLSDPDKYRWTTGAQGIENVTLTEKAQKVVVDGVIYIIRNNKMYNLQGNQVR